MAGFIGTVPWRYWAALGVLAGLLAPAFLVDDALGWYLLLVIYPLPVVGLALSYRQPLRFLGQLAALLNTGYPLTEALERLKVGQPKYAVRLTRIIHDLENGLGFAQACRRNFMAFPGRLLRLIEEGEKQGTLPSFLRAYLDYYEVKYSSQKKAVNALSYVAAVFIVCLVLALVASIFIIPVFQSLFTESGAPVPWPTTVTFQLGGLLYGWLPLLILAMIVAWAVYRTVTRRGLFPRWQRKFDTLLVLLLARTVLERGGRLEDALLSAARVPGRPDYPRGVGELVKEVEAGRSWVEALGNKPGLPPDLVAALASGAAAGDVPAALGGYLAALKEQYAAQIMLATGRLALAGVLFNGLVFGFIVVSLYLPIFGLAGTVH
ncbi:MAG: type II secretion system F family protein [Thermodesulfobacteriota bacterium]